MSLTEQIAADLIKAMKGNDKVALEAIRAAKTAFLLAKSEKGTDSVLSGEEELKIIQKLVKQRRESAAIYKENNRQDLSEKETIEADVLEKYLPARLSDEELTEIAWDSGGVTTGPVTVPLVLAMGLSISGELNIPDGFGVLALASVFPIMTVLIYGLFIRAKQRRSIPANRKNPENE